MGVPRNVTRAHCAVLRPDIFKFASYGPWGLFSKSGVKGTEGWIAPEMLHGNKKMVGACISMESSTTLYLFSISQIYVLLFVTSIS